MKKKKAKPTSFSTSRKVITVTLDGVGYEVRELSGTEISAYMEAMSKRVKLGPDGKPVGISDYSNVQSGLVCNCLYAVGEPKPVPLATINQWPASTVKGLFELCQEVNGMEPEEEEELKKPSDQEETTTSGS